MRDERFANVIPGKLRLFKEHATMAGPGQECGQSRPARSAADDDDIVVRAGQRRSIWFHNRNSYAYVADDTLTGIKALNLVGPGPRWAGPARVQRAESFWYNRKLT
jgi:hypothetical protein